MIETNCNHYTNNCKIIGGCCNKIYDCRRCHDEENDHKLSLDYKLICNKCQKQQEIHQKCDNEECGITLGSFYCEICKILDNHSDRGIYHCDKCGICRKGGQNNFFHCDSCNCCRSKNQENHKCKKDILKDNCPICLQFLDTSDGFCLFLNCSHPIHINCFKEYINHHNSQCPICKKSVLPPEIMKLQNDIYEHEISMTPMPDEYKDKKVTIYCNECQSKSETNFHIIGHKCQACGSYNTQI